MGTSDPSNVDDSSSAARRAVYAALVLVGLGIAVWAGSNAAMSAQVESEPDYRDDFDPSDRAFGDLSAAGKNYTRAALANETNQATVDLEDYPERFPETREDDGPGNATVDYIVYQQTVYRMYVDPQEVDYENGTAVVQFDTVSGAFYAHSELSERAQTVIDEARREQEVRGELPREFRAADFGAEPGDGLYFIEYRDELYELTVFERDSVSTSNSLVAPFAAMLLVGLGLVVAGGIGLARGRIRPGNGS